MRVMFVTPGDGRGCSMIFARRQARTLASMGVEVREFFLRSRTSSIAMTLELARFRREKRQFKPDVIHAQYGTATGVFTAIAAAGTPMVITYRGGDLNPSRSPRAAAGRLLSQIAALAAKRIVCVSPALRERLWWRRSRATVMPSGVDTLLFRPEPRDSARARLGWALNERVVLFNAGMNARVKRLDLARAAVERAARIIPSVRMELLDGLVPPERVPDLMNASDCLLVTSDQEGSPTVVQEALACNLPIVSVDVGDVRDRLRGVRNTFIAERNAEVLGRAIVQLVREPLRSDGARKADGFSSTRIAQKLFEVYRDAWNISRF